MDPNGDHMKKLHSREFHVPTYNFRVQKTVGFSYSNFMFRLYCNSMNGFVPFLYFSLGVSIDPNIIFIKNLCPREADVPTYLFEVQKTINISSSRVMFRVKHKRMNVLVPFNYCSTWQDLFDSLSSDTNIDHMKTLHLQKMTYEFNIIGSCLGNTIAKKMV